ncbi:MAG: four helix bundle protein [Proteobacteria bacterium]|nr:four helix bundle protein [Pseudomonadota bacterium]NIS68558.1 four helix bundle protein [Pseudomonadota bacterium]
MKVQSFEDLVAWQKARELTKQIYLVTSKEPFSKDFGLRDQIRRASVSVMSNLAEGFERGSRSEFHRFILVAKGSCAEVRSQLYVAFDVGYIRHKQFQEMMDLGVEVSRIIGGLRSAVKKQKELKK